MPSPQFTSSLKPSSGPMFWTMPCSTDFSPTFTVETIATPARTGCAVIDGDAGLGRAGPAPAVGQR